MIGLVGGLGDNVNVEMYDKEAFMFPGHMDSFCGAVEMSKFCVPGKKSDVD